MKKLLALAALVAALIGCAPALAQNSIVPTMPNGDSSNAAASTAFVQNAFAGGSSPALPQNDIFVGNASGQAAGVAMSGDCAIITSGAITCQKLNGITPGALYPLNVGTGLGSGSGNLNLQPSSAGTIGGVKSITSVSHQWINSLDTSGTLHQSQPATTDLSDFATLAPAIPIVSPSSVGSPTAVGSGCNTTAGTGAVLHEIAYTDQNWCLLLNLLSVGAVEKSALIQLTVGGTVTTGDVITLFFIQPTGSINTSVTYTTVGGDTTATIATALGNAIRANSALYNAGTGGYGNGVLFSYVPVTGSTVNADYDATFRLNWKYTVSGSSTETITSAAGNFAGEFFTAGTTGGSANAQTVAAPSGFTGSTGQVVKWTAGFTNTGAATLTVGSDNLPLNKYNAAGSCTALAASDITAGNVYVTAVNGACGAFVINTNWYPISAFSTKNTLSIVPNMWDNTNTWQVGRVTGSDSNAANGHISGAAPPGSTLWCLSPAVANTNSVSTTYGSITGYNVCLMSADLVAGQERADLFFQGTAGSGWIMAGDGGMVSYTGGCTFFYAPGCIQSKGQGTINVTGGIYLNGTAYTNPDYVLERFYTGKIERFVKSPGAADYRPMLDFDDLEKYLATHWELPGVPDASTPQDQKRSVDIFERADILLRNAEEGALREIALNKRLKKAEDCLTSWRCRLFGP